MVNSLGLPTIFFTHSAADTQWPELANLICKDNPQSKSKRTEAVIKNPAIADWFFFQRIKLFIKHFYKDILHATDYWLWFEYQHRGSPHVHGLAWLADSPNIEDLEVETPNQEKNNKSHITLIQLSQLSIQPFYPMEVIFLKHLVHNLIHTYAINHTNM